MRKVTRQLLVAGFAALIVSACQDSVSIVQPPPPPPPPPPPGIDATVTIQGLRTIPANSPVNPTAVFGDINVLLNIEEGDNTVTAVDLLFDGVPLGCQAISTNTTPGDGVALSSSAAGDVVECFWNTDGVAGACVGEQLPSAFANGTAVLGARITLDDGTTREASNAQTVTLINSDFVMVAEMFDLPGQIGANGRPYWGGPADRDGDGTDENTVAWAACPVSYNGTTVGSLEMDGFTAGGGSDVDFGSGSGAPHTDGASPFVWTVDPSDNTTTQDNPFADGHFVHVVGSIFDDSGLNVTSQFSMGGLGGNETVYLDFMAPVVAGGAEIEVGGVSVAGGEYFPGGAFGLTMVTEAGVGFTFGTGAGSQIDVGECAVADNADNDPTTDFVPDFPDLTGIDDLPEDDPVLDADGNALDCYVGEVTNLEDELGNVTDLTAVGFAINTGTPVTFFGVDRTAADITAQQPDATITVLNPDVNADGMACTDPGDCLLEFDAFDPILDSGDPGSQVDETGCDPCTFVTAEIVDGPGTINDGTFLNIGFFGTPTQVDPDFRAFMTWGSATFPLADGDYEIEIQVLDGASPPNAAIHTFMYILDDTAPTFGALNPAPVGSTGTDATAIVMTIGGTINDANIIDDAQLQVYVDGTDVSGTGSNGVCDATTDYKLSVSGGEIDRNDIDHANGTDTVGFNETFAIPQPSTAAVTVTYCFIHQAEDEAVLRDGTDTGNSSTLATQVDVTWNAG